MNKAQERTALLIFGVAGLVTLLVLAVVFPEPSKFQYDIFKTVLALAAAGVAATLPGFIEVEISGWLKTGGAMAVFALVMYKTPAALVVPPPALDPILNVRTEPDTVGIAPGGYKGVTYLFREVNGAKVTVDAQDYRWLLDSGVEIAQFKNARILGGSFTVEPNGEYGLIDNIYLPPDISSKVKDAGANRVQLETQFTAHSDEKRIKTKAILLIVIAD